jgi:hypothetical protein
MALLVCIQPHQWHYWLAFIHSSDTVDLRSAIQVTQHDLHSFMPATLLTWIRPSQKNCCLASCWVGETVDLCSAIPVTLLTCIRPSKRHCWLTSCWVGDIVDLRSAIPVTLLTCIWPSKRNCWLASCRSKWIYHVYFLPVNVTWRRNKSEILALF